MRFPPLVEGVFQSRLNRFVCLVEVEGRTQRALLRNTGRLGEVLLPGRRVYLVPKGSGKCGYEMVLVRGEGGLVCVDSHRATDLLAEHILTSGKPWRVRSIKREPRAGRSRFDLLLDGRILIETKSVNLVREGVALFPDAPTERGRRHLEDLMSLAGEFEPAVVFVIQRGDARVFSPNYGTDPEFGEVLEEFFRRGFTVKAFVCRVSLHEIRIWKEVPVVFNMSIRRWQG
jgi:sugar fermentation stimulation protein A